MSNSPNKKGGFLTFLIIFFFGFLTALYFVSSKYNNEIDKLTKRLYSVENQIGDLAHQNKKQNNNLYHLNQSAIILLGKRNVNTSVFENYLKASAEPVFQYNHEGNNILNQ